MRIIPEGLHCKSAPDKRATQFWVGPDLESAARSPHRTGHTRAAQRSSVTSVQAEDDRSAVGVCEDDESSPCHVLDGPEDLSPLPEP